MKLWVVCYMARAACDGRRVWDFRGVFSTRELAEKRCNSSEHFVAPIDLDSLEVSEDVPDKILAWPGAYYPLGPPLDDNED